MGVKNTVSTEEDVGPRVSAFEALERESIHRASKSAFEVSKRERNELYALNGKWKGIQNLFLKRGISMVEPEKELIEGENAFNDVRVEKIGDASQKGEVLEYIIVAKEEDVIVKDGFTAAKGGKYQKEGEIADQLCKEKTLKSILKPRYQGSTTGCKDKKGVEKDDGIRNEKSKSWANVIQIPKLDMPQFDFKPPPAGSVVVDPPDKLLQEGINKLKMCFTGHFSRKALLLIL